MARRGRSTPTTAPSGEPRTGVSSSSSKSTEPRRRLHVPELRTGSVSLAADAAHYVRDVLRLGPGDAVLLFDGSGRVARAQVVTVTAETVSVEAEPAEAREHAVRSVTVGLATPKGDRADWA